MYSGWPKQVKILVSNKTLSLCCTINPSKRQLQLIKKHLKNPIMHITLKTSRCRIFLSLYFPKGKTEIKLSSSTSSCWHWDSCCQAAEAIWAISILQPFEAWYANCENKRAHTPGQSGEEAHRMYRGHTHMHTQTHKHTQSWPPPTAVRDDISGEKQDNCYCQPPCYMAGKPEQVCVCVCVCESTGIRLNQQAPVPSSVPSLRETPAYSASSCPNKVLRRQEVVQWAEIR